MKRLLLIVACSFYALFSYGQNEVDALRYAFLNPIGTARFSGMGGAMGALGGDLTTMAYNPAGIGVFRTSTMAFTPTWTNSRSETAYYGSVNNGSYNNFHLGNIGFVTSAPVDGMNGFEYLNFGFAYNQLNNFSQGFLVSGVNDYGSYLDGETQGVNDYGPDGNLFVDADVIYYDDDANGYINDYMLNDPMVYGAEQSKSVRSTGYGGQYDFSLATNYMDVLYMGFSMGIMHVAYEESSFYNETPPTVVPNLYDFESNDYFRTKGNGFNFKFGLIGRVNDWLRLGAGIHTPTFFSLRDSYSSEVNATIEYDDGLSNNTAKTGEGYFEWELNTPFKALGSAALIFGKHGLISFDYEFVDYSSMSMQAVDYLFVDENNQIANIYGIAHNLKAGGEFNMGPLVLRAGYAYYGSAFEDSQANKDAFNSIISGGVGFRSKVLFVDFTTKYSKQNEYYYLYGSLDSQSSLEKKQISYITSIGFKF